MIRVRRAPSAPVPVEVGPNEEAPDEPSAVFDAEQLAERIRGCWRSAVESIVEVGRLLVEAKEMLPHGDWRHFFDRLPFGQHTGSDLMNIAKHGVLGDSQHAENLPPAWSTLAVLASLPEDAVLKFLADRRIDSEMSRADADELVREHGADGTYLFESVAEAVATLAKFARRYIDPQLPIAPKLPEEIVDIAVDKLTTADCVAAGKLLAALREAMEARERWWDEHPEEVPLLTAPPPKAKKRRRRGFLSYHAPYLRSSMARS